MHPPYVDLSGNFCSIFFYRAVHGGGHLSQVGSGQGDPNIPMIFETRLVLP